MKTNIIVIYKIYTLSLRTVTNYMAPSYPPTPAEDQMCLHSKPILRDENTWESGPVSNTATIQAGPAAPLPANGDEPRDTPRAQVRPRPTHSAHQCPGQFLGFRAKVSFSTSKVNMRSPSGGRWPATSHSLALHTFGVTTSAKSRCRSSSFKMNASRVKLGRDYVLR